MLYTLTMRLLQMIIYMDNFHLFKSHVTAINERKKVKYHSMAILSNMNTGRPIKKATREPLKI